MFSFRNWVRKQARPVAPLGRAHLGVATLEDRTVPSAYFVIGSNLDDSIAISGTPSSLTITNNGANPIVARPSLSQAQGVVNIAAGTSFTYTPATAVTTLEVRGGDGNDTITAADLIGLGVTVDGGNGNDTITGTRRSDTLRGGVGTDTISGGEVAIPTADGPQTVDVGLSQIAGPNLRTWNDATNAYSVAGGVTNTGTQIASADVRFSGINVTANGEVAATIAQDSGEGMGITGGSNTGSVPNKRVNGTEIFRAELLGGRAAGTAEVRTGTVNAGSMITIKAYLGGELVGEIPAQPATSSTSFVVSFGSNVVFDRLDISGGTQGFALRSVGFGNLVTGFGSDTIDGGADADTIDGGAGNDTFIANFSDLAFDTIQGGSGHDAIQLNPGRNQSDPIELNLFGPTNGIEALRGGGFVRGTGGDDTLNFSAVTEWTTGRRIEVLGGADVVTAPSIADGVGGFFGFVINGGAGADTLTGGAGNDRIDGGTDNDTIDGGAGDDMIRGGTGFNTLTGGLGEDTFFFHDSTEGQSDHEITDFTDGEDKLRFQWPVNQTVLNGTAPVSGRFVWDANTDTLFLPNGKKLTLTGFAGTFDNSDVLFGTW